MFKDTDSKEEIDLCNKHWTFRWTSPLGGYERTYKKVYSLYGEQALALYQSAIKGWWEACKCFNQQRDLKESTLEAINHLRKSAGILNFLAEVMNRAKKIYISASSCYAMTVLLSSWNSRLSSKEESK